MSQPPIRLYCLPYAGSSATVYLRWKRQLPAWIEVVPVELPGRGRRIGEPLELTVPGVLDRIAADVRPEPGRPFALFGHSMGAILAFELGLRLERQALSPAVIFVSGARAPGRRDLARYASLQSDAELRSELERLGGTPASVLADPELMELMLPVLRADFQVAGGYVGERSRPLRAPLVALGGAADETTSDGLDAWRELTLSEFSLHVLEGGHFFIHASEAELLAIVQELLRHEVGTGGRGASGRGASGPRPPQVTARSRALCPTDRESDSGLGRG
jgi:surfactin synthase thioesterase subunit